MENLRNKNLEIRPASYLLPRDKWPKNPSYHIDYWYPNGYYKRENDFIKDGDYYIYSDAPFCRVHKDCFKSPESCYAIASFNYDEHENLYELAFIGDRPLRLNEEERKIFWELIEYGYNQLNNNEE